VAERNPRHKLVDHNRRAVRDRQRAILIGTSQMTEPAFHTAPVPKAAAAHLSQF
jgi:hypothetical protein